MRALIDSDVLVDYLQGRSEAAAELARYTERAVRLRRKHRLKLPDAIIWASAQEEACRLVTHNTKDFPADDEGIRFPYAG